MKYLTRRQVALEYPIRFSTLAHLASRGAGPAYAVIGKRAVYLRQDIEEWLESKKMAPIKNRLQQRKRGRPRKGPSQVQC